jgi:hypothetical protein
VCVCVCERERERERERGLVVFATLSADKKKLYYFLYISTYMIDSYV